MNLKWRKSKAKNDSLAIAEKIAEKYKIDPYNLEELRDIVLAEVRGEVIKKERKGNSYYVTGIEEWFTEKIMPSTVVLSEDDYKKALYRSFRLLVLGNIAKTDFGSSRQRDFGQIWTDFTRGFLGEIGIEKFFKEKLGLEINLEEIELGDVKKFLPSDITKVKEGNTWRNTKMNVSIKTSKIGSLWLDIGSQLQHSDAFIFIKIALTTDHLLSFMKDNGLVARLVKMGEQLGEVSDEQTEIDSLNKRIKDIKPVPVYIAGFALKRDMQEGSLIVHQTKRKRIVVGGIGEYRKETADEVIGLGDILPGKHLACISSLRWKKEDWNTIKKGV